MVARICLDILRSRKVRREEPLNVRGPEPFAGGDVGVDPEHESVLADSVGLALLVVLEILAPAERLAFVSHNMFAVPFDETAPIVGCLSAAARQLASRARRRVQGVAAVPTTGGGGQGEIIEASWPPPVTAISRTACRPRPRRQTPSRQRRCAGRRIRGSPRVGRRGRHLLGAGPGRTAGPGERIGGGGVGSRWASACRFPFHDHRQKDRRNRIDRRSRTCSAARPGGHRRLTGPAGVHPLTFGSLWGIPPT